ncbi:uroporphyrinogen III methyltransferase [Desulfuromonas versatilis]|uniref:uroporphyrinogen-III C-methyltransferase n=1 Tax=Desulfuromonas versatilis TaxID=2802975 RepID=A0ABN6DTM8_9BACT|nr:uroporphyrinogen-III C-methyltransferase [Desulfuromonas versatilis]BCR03496.1 uroporphyrinogen III methyltransferase [Desulfuromonas versatilis]
MKQGIVYLIGAGPGDPGLITVKGQECLRRAEVVIYDYLANPAFLDEAPACAERIYVGKTRGCHHTPQESINRLLAEKAKQGKVVARLKGGDPYVFGRGGEEALHLHHEGVRFEVIPGVTAGFAAAAYAGIPLTHRDFTTSLALVTGHENPEKKMSSLDWQKLATGVGTLAFYMGMANLPLIAEQLMAHGRPADTPVAVIRWATTPRQRTLVATLADVVEKVRQAAFKPPAVIVVGEVVRLREQLRWFDDRPLFGKRVLVTRTAEQAGSFGRLLEAQGAEAISCPVIDIVPPPSWEELDREIDGLEQTDILILTSANAVDAFFERLRACGRDVRALHGVTVVAVGPKTAAAIETRGLRPDLVPADYRAEGVVALLLERGVAGKRVLYPRAEIARELIPRELSAAGASVAAPVVYRTLAPTQGKGQVLAALEEGIDAVTFTSSSTVENFVAMLGDDAPQRLEKVPVISIGPLTTATARRLGLTVAAEAAASTLEGMVEAMVEYFSRNPEVRIQKPE